MPGHSSVGRGGIMAPIGGTGWFTKYFMSCFSGILSMKFSTY